MSTRYCLDLGPASLAIIVRGGASRHLLTTASDMDVPAEAHESYCGDPRRVSPTTPNSFSFSGLEYPVSKPTAGEFRVFVVGCPRSGTTLLRIMLDKHPKLAIPPESHFVLPALRAECNPAQPPHLANLRNRLSASSWFHSWAVPLTEVEQEWSDRRPDDGSEALRGVFRCYARRQGKELFGDKTPWYGTDIPTLARAFPEARFVHIIRDGRDVALSLLERVELPPYTVPAAIAHWRRRVLAASVAGAALGPKRYCEVRYEDLLEDPEWSLRRLCMFLDLDFSPQMLEYSDSGREAAMAMDYPQYHRNLVNPPTKGVRDWRTAMLPRDQHLFEALAGDVLRRYGYPLNGTPAGARARVSLVLRLTGVRVAELWRSTGKRVVLAATASR